MSVDDDDNEEFVSTTVLDTYTFINSGTNEDEVVRRKQEDAGMDNIQDDEACTIDDDDFLTLLGIQTDSSNDTTATDCEDTKKLLKRVPSSSSCSEDDMEFENFLSLLDGMNDTDNSVSVDNMMDNNISMLEMNDDVDPTSVLSSIIPPRQLEEDFVISNMSDGNITSLSSLPSSPQSLMEKKETSTTRATRSNSIEHQEQGTSKLRSGGSNKRLRVRSSMSSRVKRRFRTTTTTSTTTDTDNITVPSSLSEQVDVGGLSKVEKIMEPSQRRYTTRSQRGKVHPLKYN